MYNLFLFINTPEECWCKIIYVCHVNFIKIDVNNLLKIVFPIPKLI